MVTPARFERTTYRLGGGCSILLSYGARSLPIAQRVILIAKKWNQLLLGGLSHHDKFVINPALRDKPSSAFWKCYRSVSFRQTQINQP